MAWASTPLRCSSSSPVAVFDQISSRLATPEARSQIRTPTGASSCGKVGCSDAIYEIRRPGMERLIEMARPRTLDAIVGQPAVEYLQAFAAEPYSKCMAFVGPPGTGKSTAALAMIDALNCRDEFPGHVYRNASEITMDE